jgi:hypothetical protein
MLAGGLGLPGDEVRISRHQNDDPEDDPVPRKAAEIMRGNELQQPAHAEERRLQWIYLR